MRYLCCSSCSSKHKVHRHTQMLQQFSSSMTRQASAQLRWAVRRQAFGRRTVAIQWPLLLRSS
jgi:hypothetical protein